MSEPASPPSAPPPKLARPRRVLVVGATGRLGVAIARALQDRGDRLILTARHPGRLAALGDELRERLLPSGGRAPAAATIVCDLRDTDAPERIAREARAAGGLDDLVLACGPFPRTPLEELRREDLQETLTVHAIAPLLLVSALADDLAARFGAVVALADAGVARPFTNHVAYLTAKGALQTGLRALAVELAPNVRINVVALGIVADPEADADPLRTHRLAARSPLGRFGTPAEVVHAVLALLDATWSTGEIWGIGR
jgi:pteridine reductase